MVLEITITGPLMNSSGSKLLKSHLPCPLCPSRDAYSTWSDGHGYCYSCLGYVPGNKEFILSSADFTYEYLTHRGLDRRTLEFYNIKTKIDADGKPVAVGFKYPNGAYKIRQLADKKFHSEGAIAEAGLFGRDKFSAGSHKYVTITEGEYDAASLWQVVQSPVVSVQSSGVAARDCALDREYLNSFERIYLAFDGDAMGRKATSSVAKLFDYNKVFVVRFTKRKDANEFLQHGESEELRNIWNNSKRYLPETVESSFSIFEQIITEKTREGVPYPFPTLTQMTYGIRTAESVLLTAQEGVGKTELMHAFQYQLLKETDDAIGAIFLEEPKRRHLQAIAGLELRKPVHLPDCGVSDAEIFTAVKKAVRMDDRLHVYSHFGSDDPEVLLDTIRFLVTARACRYVLLDHITMAVSGLGGEDERRALDYLSTRLEMMVKELDFSLILVSHVNDAGLTRGSRYISKIADIRIDATRDVTHADPIERNRTYLTVAKNRFSGRTGPAGVLIFDPTTYTFSEEGAANDNTPWFARAERLAA